MQEKGFDIPDYPDDPTNDNEREISQRYSRVLGSAVNPDLREGNSDRRSARAVKEHGKRNPHRMIQNWPEVSKTRVAHMTSGDFFGSEQSVTVTNNGLASIQFMGQDETVTVLKDNISLVADEIIDCSFLTSSILL